MVNWTADKDALLLVGIFEYMDIKVSGALLQHLAGKIGEGCTPKAVSHRLNNMKKKGAAASGNGPATPSKPTTTGTPKTTPKPKATTTPRTGGRARKGKTNKDVTPENDEEDTAQSPSIGKKRGRMSTPKAKAGGVKRQNEEEDGDTDEEKSIKKIKVEKTEDNEDEGFVDVGEVENENGFM